MDKHKREVLMRFATAALKLQHQHLVPAESVDPASRGHIDLLYKLAVGVLALDYELKIAEAQIENFRAAMSEYKPEEV